jgi:hypothetical protein
VTPEASPALFDAEPRSETPVAARPARVVPTGSRLLFQALDDIYAALGLGALDDDVFRDLVMARVVEPTSVLDTGRVLAELGRKAASDKTMRRTLARCAGRGYRDKIAGLCFAHALASGHARRAGQRSTCPDQRRPSRLGRRHHDLVAGCHARLGPARRPGLRRAAT